MAVSASRTNNHGGLCCVCTGGLVNGDVRTADSADADDWFRGFVRFGQVADFPWDFSGRPQIQCYPTIGWYWWLGLGKSRRYEAELEADGGQQAWLCQGGHCGTGFSLNEVVCK